MTTALAIRPEDHMLLHEVEFRRCTGHCCDPVTLGKPPGYFQRWRNCADATHVFVARHFIYLGWRPPSQGGWPGGGTFLYRCQFFDRGARRCTIYGQGLRPPLCRNHPHYNKYGPWEVCNHAGCTRRTMVLSMDDMPLRDRFPDLREARKRE